MSDLSSEAGAAIYSKKVLSIYDPFVLGFSSTFAWGRYGMYVSTGETGNYTFSVKEIRTWGAE